MVLVLGGIAAAAAVQGHLLSTAVLSAGALALAAYLALAAAAASHGVRQAVTRLQALGPAPRG
jgi:hypothetical protein